jgi:hypothetical protein
MSTKRKYNELKLGEKLALLADVEGGMSYRNCASKYNISLGSVGGIIKKKDELRSRSQNNEATSSKRASRVAGDAATIDERVFNWFSAARSNNIPISGPIIQEKALVVASCLGLRDFKASNGWLEAFRRRHNIAFRTLSGESADMDESVLSTWKENLPTVLRGYELKDVWNIDETGLFWRCLPTKSLTAAGENAKGGKLSKERLTVCLLASATGEIFKPLVIGKAEMPRAFLRRLPSDIYWKNNQKAWMTGAFFLDYLKLFNDEMKRKGRTVALLLDNAPCHPHVNLSNVKLVFFTTKYNRRKPTLGCRNH